MCCASRGHTEGAVSTEQVSKKIQWEEVGFEDKLDGRVFISPFTYRIDI